VRALTRENRELIRDRNGGRIVVADVDRISADRVHRPVKSTKLTLHSERPTTLGTPVKIDGRKPGVLDRTRTRTVRRPVLDKPPVPRPRSVHTTTVDRPPTRTPTRTVEKPRDRDRTPPRVTSRPVPSSPPPTEKPHTETRVKVKSPPPPKPQPRTEEPVRESPPPPPPPHVTPKPAPAPERKAPPTRTVPPGEKRTKTRGRPR
jgi:hypothetical protein